MRREYDYVFFTPSRHKRCINVGLTLINRLRRWIIVKPALIVIDCVRCDVLTLLLALFIHILIQLERQVN